MDRRCHPTRRLLAIATLATPLLVGVGCSSVETPAADAGRSPEAAPTVIDFRRGMTTNQVEALIGKPDEIRDVQPAESAITVWVYRRNIGSRVDGVAPTMTSEPWIDPITGELRFLERPEITEQRMDFIEELRLYFSRGLLANATRTVRPERSFSR